MKKILKILLFSLVSIQVYAGPGSSGGGMPMPPHKPCQEVAGNIVDGSYIAAGGIGTMQVSGNLVRAVLFQPGPADIPFNFKGFTDRYGRFHGTSSFEGGKCPFEITITRFSCGDNEEQIRMLIPFWAFDYHWQSNVYNNDCNRAYQDSNNRTSSPSKLDFYLN